MHLNVSKIILPIYGHIWPCWLFPGAHLAHYGQEIRLLFNALSFGYVFHQST